MDGSNDVEHAGEFSWESQGDPFRGGDGHVIERMLWYYQIPSCIVYPICRWHVRVDATLMQTQLHGKLHSMLIKKTVLSLLNKKEYMTCFWPVFSLQRTSTALSDVVRSIGSPYGIHYQGLKWLEKRGRRTPLMATRQGGPQAQAVGVLSLQVTGF